MFGKKDVFWHLFCLSVCCDPYFLFSENLNLVRNHEPPSEEQEYVILRAAKKGMFAEIFDIIALLISYERGDYAGIEVDFERTGLY